MTSSRRQGPRRAISAVTALGGAGVLFATCGIAPVEAASRSGVATTTVNIRTGASTSAAIVGRLVRGQKITVSGTSSGDWVTVRFRGSTAYMDGDYLDRTGARPAAPRTIPASGTKIATEDLNIRAGAGTRYRIVGELAEGGSITLTGRFSGRYAQFRFGGALRWAYAAYLAQSIGGTPSDSAPGTSGAQRVVQPAPEASGSNGQTALAFARAQLGEQYAFGATGPNRWDCSGLTAGRLARRRGLDPANYLHPVQGRHPGGSLRSAPGRPGVLLRLESQPRGSVRWQRHDSRRASAREERLLQQDQLDAVRRRSSTALRHRPREPADER